MKKIRLKNFIKKHKVKLMIFTWLFFGGMSFAGATIYFSAANVSYSNSNMSATNVQKAIEELHATAKPCVPKYAQMGASIVTSGDGLYADSVESGRYIYRGANPNNYICLAAGSGTCAAADLYRIIAIEPDGTLKVIKNTSIGDMVWDPGYSTSGTPPGKSASSVNGTRRSSTSTDYCYVSTTSSYNGCKSWGSSTSTYSSDGTTKVTKMPSETGSSTTKTLPTYDSYLNVYLNGGKYLTTSVSGNSSTYQTITGWISSQNNTITNNIVDYAYNVGPLKLASGQTTSTDVSQESAYKWIGKVALINVSDYVRASTNSSCTGAYAYYNTSGCYDNSSTHNWLFSSAKQWTLSPHSISSTIYVCYVTSAGRLNYYIAYNSGGVQPVLHLSSSITLTGSGSNDANVYRIA